MEKKIGYEFMQKTKKHTTLTAQQRGTEQPPLELAAPPDAKRVALPRPETLEMPVMDLRIAIEQRTSVRQYSDTPLSLAELSYLLWTTQGVKEISSRPVTLRTVPSAGARHAFETFVLANRVEGLAPGLYRFLASEHALILADDSPTIAEDLTVGCYKQAMVNRAAVAFFWVAVVDRMFWRYDERGYRYLHLDAGHVCQNLYLAGESLGCGTCAIAAFDDDLLNQALQVDGKEMFVVYAATTGKKSAMSG
jgi:SagB-type dehydrogenase family enzyme